MGWSYGSKKGEMIQTSSTLKKIQLEEQKKMLELKELKDVRKILDVKQKEPARYEIL